MMIVLLEHLHFSILVLTFVKHFISRQQAPTGEATQNCKDTYVAGYFNTISAINAVQFSMSSGNIDSGVIKLYGVS